MQVSCPCKNSDPCKRGLTVDYQATNGDYQKPLPPVYVNLCELVSFTRSILLVNIPLCHIIDLLFNLFDKNQGHRKADQPKFRSCSTFTWNESKTGISGRYVSLALTVLPISPQCKPERNSYLPNRKMWLLIRIIL